MANEKYCVKCGRKFIPVGREVICPQCKAQAAEEAKKAAVLRAKRASWTGESVPVRISGRASTVIRSYGKANSLPFAAALDALLQSTAFFSNLDVKWETIVPYKSRRQDATQDAPQASKASKPQEAPQDTPQAAKATKAAKVASKTSSKAASKTSSKK